MPKKSKPAKRQPLYRRPPPKPAGLKSTVHSSQSKAQSPKSAPRPSTGDSGPATADFSHPHFLAPSHFTLREDGSVAGVSDFGSRVSGTNSPDARRQTPSPRLVFSSDNPFLRLYHGNCLELLDAIAAKYPEGRFDAIFADPPYFLSNGGITCHAGKMVKVDKGGWDVSRGPELNHEFNREWLRRCQKVLKPNGTIWVTGTHHVIFSIGYALQQLGYKILNDIAWEKPNPPPNLSCRYFTHSTETVLWAAKNAKSKHVFNYQEMRRVTGKQMKTVWRKEEWSTGELEQWSDEKTSESAIPATHLSNTPTLQSPNTPPLHHSTTPLAPTADPSLESIWTLSAPGNDEKRLLVPKTDPSSRGSAVTSLAGARASGQ